MKTIQRNYRYEVIFQSAGTITMNQSHVNTTKITIFPSDSHYSHGGKNFFLRLRGSEKIAQKKVENGKKIAKPTLSIKSLTTQGQIGR